MHLLQSLCGTMRLLPLQPPPNPSLSLAQMERTCGSGNFSQYKMIMTGILLTQVLKSGESPPLPIHGGGSEGPGIQFTKRRKDRNFRARRVVAKHIRSGKAWRCRVWRALNGSLKANPTLRISPVKTGLGSIK